MKNVFKRIILVLCFVMISPLILLTRLGFIFKVDDIFNASGCILSLIPGKIGSYVRVAYYIGTIKKMSPDVVIGFGSFFSRKSAEVGRNVSIGAYCILGTVALNDDVLIASRVSIPSGRHQHRNSPISPNNIDRMKWEKVQIGYRSWIGEGSVVMADVGEDCIIGAGSIVTKPVDSNTVAVGNPARQIKERN